MPNPLDLTRFGSFSFGLNGGALLHAVRVVIEGTYLYYNQSYMCDYMFCQWQIFWLLAKADILLLLLLPPHSAAENLTLNSPHINIAG